MFHDWRDQIPDIRPARKAKVKPVTAPAVYDHKALYLEAHRYWFERTHKVPYNAGHYTGYKVSVPAVRTTNGFSKYIVNVINFYGHHAERVNTGGTPMFINGKPVLNKKGKPKFRRSGSTNGSTDIHCEIKIPSMPVAAGWKIEVKNKDFMRDEQLDYGAKMKRVGVLHSVFRVGELDRFWDEYWRIIKL